MQLRCAPSLPVATVLFDTQAASLARVSREHASASHGTLEPAALRGLSPEQVAAVQQAFAWAPDVNAQEELHREGLDRIWLLRLYEEARRRLVDAGARLPDGGALAVAKQRSLADARGALITNWPRYRASL